MTFAARDFSPRRGVSDEHIPQWICEERATKSGRKSPAALRVAPTLACGFVARRLQPQGRGCALLAPRHRPNWAQRTSPYLCLRPLSGERAALSPPSRRSAVTPPVGGKSSQVFRGGAECCRITCLSCFRVANC